MSRLRDLARRATNGVMNSEAPGLRATVVAQTVARVADQHPAVAAAAGVAGAIVVAAEQHFGRYERPEGGYATFHTDKDR